MIYSIYKITNKVNGKVYIGFTQDIKRRWKQHINDHKKIQRPLYESMIKHGIDSFEFEVLYESEDREHTLTIMEPFYIKLYDSYNKGYNCNEGGLNTNTDELRESNSNRMKNSNPMKILRTNKGSFKKGHKPIITEERNDKIRQSKLGKNNHNFGNREAAAPLNIKIVCDHCGATMNKGNYVRWHKNKCQKTII